jgi:hypothetical protein
MEFSVRSRSGLAQNNGSNAGMAYIAFLLVIWAIPSVASSGIHVDCDRPGSGAHGQTSTSVALNIEFIDHGVTKAGIGKSDFTSIAETAGSAPRESTEVDSRDVDSFDLGSRAESILQEVFEKSSGAPQSASALVQIDSSELKPLATTEATTGAISSNSATRSERVTTNISPEIDGIEIRLPGLSDAELLKFRRQMYRTDI